jgi:glycosyltransferase involved in cell wall biosynthesis
MSAVNKLRIAVVTETYPPEVNGVAATIAVMVQGLLARGHQIEVIRPRQPGDGISPVPSLYAEHLVRGFPIPGYNSLRFGVPSTGSLIKKWRCNRPDVVQVVTEGPLGWSATRAARKLGIPCASEFHTNFDTYASHYRLGWLSRPIAAYLRSLHNGTAVTMVPTRELGKSLETSGFHRISVVSRGVDTQRFHPGKRNEALRASWGATPTCPVVVHVSRIAAEKNLDTLFRVFDQMALRRPDARLVVVGDGPERARYQRMYPQHIFAGLRRGEDLAEHYASSDLFLYPSLSETFGNVIVEAMASGLAVIAYNYAAPREHIQHGVNGLVATFGDEAALCTEACGIVSDFPRMERLRQTARTTAESFDWQRVLDALEGTLHDAIQPVRARAQKVALVRPMSA